MQPVVPENVDHNPNGHDATTILPALHGLEGGRRWSFRYELLSDRFVVLAELDNVESASIEQNWLADIKRTAKFRLRETTFINYLTDMIRPWVRLHVPPYQANDWVEWSQGVFLLSTPTRTIAESGHVFREVEGYDLLQFLLDDKMSARFTVPVGTEYTAQVMSLLYSRWHSIISPLTLPATLEWEPGTSRLTIVNDLLSAVNYQPVSVREDGVFLVLPYQSPAERGAEFEYGSSPDSITLPQVDQTLDLFSIPNRWVLVVSEPDRDPIVGVYTNTNAASITSTVRRGRLIVDFRTEQDAADAATLTAKAQRIGFEASQVYEAIDFQSGLNPLHSGNDVYRIIHPKLGLDAKFVEHRWSMELRAGAPMEHRCRRVVNLGA